MVYVSVSYNYSPDFKSPQSWLKRIAGSAGILECLSEENMVVNIKQIDYEGISKHNGVEYHFVDFGKKKTFAPWRLNRYIKTLKPDIVIVQGLHHPLQVIQLGLLLGKKSKIIAHHHAEKPFTGLKKYVQRMAGRFVKAYLFASKQMGLNWVAAGNIGSTEKVHEVMEVSSTFHPIKKTEARLKTGVEGDNAFLWVGRLNDNKDPMTAIKAFARFVAINPDARLYMIYHTDELLQEIIKLIDCKHLNNNVVLVGKKPHEELHYWFNSAGFFLSCSHYEGSGTALCEAMSCGCIPVVTAIQSFRMITNEGQCGLLFKPGDGEALVSALVNSQTINVAEKQKACLDYFQQKLSFKAIAGKIQEIAEG